MMIEDDRTPSLICNRAGLTSFRWRTRAEDKGLSPSEAVSDYLKIPKDEAAGLIDFGSVYVRGRIERNPSTILSGDEEISVTFPAYGIRRFYEIDPARIIFRDRFILAYDKEAGIPSQQVPDDAYNNVFAALLRHLAGSKEPRSLRALCGPSQQARQGNERCFAVCARKEGKRAPGQGLPGKARKKGISRMGRRLTER